MRTYRTYLLEGGLLMNTELTIEELAASVLQELEKMHYQPGTIQLYRSFYKRLAAFAKSVGEERYSEDLGQRYMRTATSRKDQMSGRAMVGFPMRYLKWGLPLHVILEQKKDLRRRHRSSASGIRRGSYRKACPFWKKRQSYISPSNIDGLCISVVSTPVPRRLVRTTAGYLPQAR